MISNEEAIAYFKRHLDLYCVDGISRESEEMAIKALEQEPCEDSVSRKALIERINYAEENFKADNMESIASDNADPFIDGVLSGVFCIREMVIQAPPVTPQQPRWISCSERLPTENITVIGTNKFDDIYKAELYDDCGEKKWYADGNFDVPIVAWMPFPQSYAESENKA